MKISLKAFACAAVAVVFFACSNDSNDQISPRCKANIQSSISIPYDELDPSCSSEHKKLVRVTDARPLDIDWDYVYEPVNGASVGGSNGGVSGGGVSGGMNSNADGSSTFFLNGEEVSEQEYFERVDEMNRRHAEEVSLKSKRDLPILCVISEGLGTWQPWIALLTDEEIAELKKEYGSGHTGLMISEISEDYFDDRIVAGNGEDNTEIKDNDASDAPNVSACGN